MSARRGRIDWSGCPYVVPDPDGGGYPVVKGIERLPVEALVTNHMDGESVEDVAILFECPVQIVRAIIAYWQAKGSETARDE